jgi:Fur family transcriptional regulator, stress-responsive regulator
MGFPGGMKRPGDAAELSEELSRHGLRTTRQRVALLRLLRAAKHHPTAIELHKALRREQRNVSKKTVYEILNAFVREGLAGCVTDGGEPFRYESMTEPHYHARCRICARIFDLPAGADSQIRGLAQVPEGFQVEAIGVTLRGVCLRCRDDV